MGAAFFSQEWADAAREAINGFPDDAYRETKLFMYWDWITAAKQSFNGSLALAVTDLPANGSSGPHYATFTFSDGDCTSAAVSAEQPADATFVVGGSYDTWKDILAGYDAGKAVMYRRLRLQQGDLFRFFNRIYLFTESLVALSKVPATLPA
jgi:putative sterol carrier protein